MRLIRIEIEEFGKLRDRSFELSAGMNLFEGPNESGKSTLLAFLRFVFYGFPRRGGSDGEERELRLSWQGHRAAGELLLETESGKFRILRAVTRQGGVGREGFSERLCVLEAETGTEVALGGKTPGEYFLGLPATLYDSTLCLRQSDAARVSSPDVGEAVGELLFAGPSGVRADTALEKLNLARRELQHRKGRGGRIAELEEAVPAQESAWRRACEDARELEALNAEAQGYRMAIERHRAQLEEVLHAFEQAGIAQQLSLFEQRHVAMRRFDQKKLELEGVLAKNAELHVPHADIVSGLEGAVRRRSAAQESISRIAPELVRLRAMPYQKEMLEAQQTVLEKGGAEAVLADFQCAESRRRRSRVAAWVLCLIGLVFATVFGLIATGALSWLWKMLPVGTYPFDLSVGLLALGAVLLLCGLFFAHGAWRARRRMRAWIRRLHVPNAAMFRTYLEQCSAESEGYEAHRSVLEGLEAERSAHEAQILECEAYIANVMRDFGFADVYRSVEDLPQCLAALQERRRAAQAAADAARLEVERAAAAVEALSRPLEGQSEALLRARFTGAPAEGAEVLSGRRDALRREIAGLEERLRSCEQRIAALSATAQDPTRMQARYEALSSELSEARARLEAVDLSIRAMETAVSDLRSGLTPRLCEEASAILAELTNGAYTTLHPTADFSVLLECEQGALPLSRFSAGCRDAAHLALRLGLLATLSEERLPLLLDEALARLDDDRAHALLSVLLSYCAAGGQCLMFTCHGREADFLVSADVTYFQM